MCGHIGWYIWVNFFNNTKGIQMMKWFLMVLMALVLCSCGTTMYQLHTTCEQSNEEIFQSLTSVLLSSNFLVKQNDPKNGYLQAETMPVVNANETQYKIWTFQIVDSIPKNSAVNDGERKMKKMVCSAKEVTVLRNAFGWVVNEHTEYYNDKSHKIFTWYWDIRNRIQQMCSDIRIIEKKVN